MNRLRMLLILLTVVSGLFAVSDTLLISNPETYKKPVRTPVMFTHKGHEKSENMACRDCHHRYEHDKNVISDSELKDETGKNRCSACHSCASDLTQAYHESCIKCHERAHKAGKVAGPRLCAECHPWKKK